MSSEPSAPSGAAPCQVVIHQVSRRLELQWANGQAISLGHAHLRRACKCAWCEGSRRRQTDGTSAGDPDVHLTAVTAIGDVGLQLRFSDGHDRGIFPWAYLQALATRSKEDHDHVQPVL